MIEHLLVRSPHMRGARRTRGLVLVPTRELAIQVQRALATYGAPVNVRVAAIVGRVAMRPQVNALRNGVDIVVATPGRLIDICSSARSICPASRSSRSMKPTDCWTWALRLRSAAC